MINWWNTTLGLNEKKDDFLGENKEKQLNDKNTVKPNKSFFIIYDF